MRGGIESQACVLAEEERGRRAAVVLSKCGAALPDVPTNQRPPATGHATTARGCGLRGTGFAWTIMDGLFLSFSVTTP